MITTCRIIDCKKGYEFQGPRYRNLGPNSGEEFRDEFLIPFLKSGGSIIDFEGTKVFTPSFMEEAFGGACRMGYEKEVDGLTFKNLPEVWFDFLKRVTGL